MIKFHFYFVLLLAFATPQVWSQITPPSQPGTGPGGTNYPFLTYDSTRYGTNIGDMYWLFEPNSPHPDSVPVIVVFHGTLQNYFDSTLVPLNEIDLLRHFAKMGFIIIYPLYQYGGNTLSYVQQLSVSANIINLALTELDNGPHVKPKRDSNGKVLIGITGYSRGGMMALELANNYQSLGLPQVDAIADFVGGGNYDSYGGLPTNTKIIIVRAEHDAYTIASLQEIEAAWDSLYAIPCSNKNYLEINSDSLGNPPLTANHYFFVTDPFIPNSVNAIDYYGSWKFCIGLFNCTFYGTNCNYVFGTGNNVRSMGNWSNGVPVTPITVLDSCSFVTIEENAPDENSQILIFPNPFSESASFDFGQENFDFDKIIIYETTGEISMIIMRSDNKQCKIEKGTLQAGLHYCNFMLHDEIVKSGKFLVQ